MRTTPVEVGTQPYDWNSKNKYQCTWYAYYRCGEKGLPYPCWWDRATKTGAYTNAKLWLENYRDPWVPKGIDYIPVENDIVVFNGTYGHVAFIEKVSGDTAILSQYMSGKADSFSNYAWKIGTGYTGPLLGYLHCPKEIIEPVDRNENIDQIKVNDNQLRIRTKPNLSGEIVGHAQLGYYNVFSITEATPEDMGKVSGLTCWYEIAKGRYCANLATDFLPKPQDDIIRQIENYFNKMKAEITNLTDENTKLKTGVNEIIDIGNKLLK